MIYDFPRFFPLVPKIVKIALSLYLKCLKHCTNCSLQHSYHGTGFYIHVIVAKTPKNACCWLELLLDYISLLNMFCRAFGHRYPLWCSDLTLSAKIAASNGLEQILYPLKVREKRRKKEGRRHTGEVKECLITHYFPLNPYSCSSILLCSSWRRGDADRLSRLDGLCNVQHRDEWKEIKKKGISNRTECILTEKARIKELFQKGTGHKTEAQPGACVHSKDLG